MTAIAVILFPEHVTVMVAPDPDCVVPPVTPILSAAIEMVPFVHVLLVHPDVQLARRDPLRTPVQTFELHELQLESNGPTTPVELPPVAVHDKLISAKPKLTGVKIIEVGVLMVTVTAVLLLDALYIIASPSGSVQRAGLLDKSIVTLPDDGVYSMSDRGLDTIGGAFKTVKTKEAVAVPPVAEHVTVTLEDPIE